MHLHVHLYIVYRNNQYIVAWAIRLHVNYINVYVHVHVHVLLHVHVHMYNLVVEVEAP